MHQTLSAPLPRRTDPRAFGHQREMRGVGWPSTVLAAWVLTLPLAACGKTRSAREGNAGATTSGGSAMTAGESTQLGGEPAVLNAGPSEARRLTAFEYEATVTDVLGTSFEPQLAEFTMQGEVFDNEAAINIVTEPLYGRYVETAEALADEVFASETLRPRFVVCQLPDDAECTTEVASQAGLRLFRRPLLQAELDAYQKVYERARERGLEHDASLKEILIALLASAQFVYRLELAPTQPGIQPVEPYDLASRLSYLLWSSAPDDELLTLAEQDALASDEQLAQSVTRLLDDPKATRLSTNFGGQWLGARRLAARPFDAQRFPDWTPELAATATAELETWFEDLLDADRDISWFFESPGIDRRGFLGLVGFLAQTSTRPRSSPSGRADWIAKWLLCTPVPTPPPSHGVGADAPEDTIREYLQGLDPACASCHSYFDPLGLALENYDQVGRFRETYPNGKPIDAHVTLPDYAGLPAGMEVTGLSGLSDALANTPSFHTCLTQQLYRYAFGRPVTDDERPHVEALAEKWRGGPLTLRQLLLELAQSSSFRLRDGGGP